MFRHLLLTWVILEGLICNAEKTNDFVETLDFAPIFGTSDGPVSLASSPLTSAFLKADKRQYPALFDTVVSSSINSIQRRAVPKDDIFAPQNFGFNPIASQGFYPPKQKSAKLVNRNTHQPITHLPIRQQFNQYDIRTIHPPNYKVYTNDETEKGEEILAALKQNPSVAEYFHPANVNIEVAHPQDYRKEDVTEKPEVENDYNPNAYITGSSRIRRYANKRISEKLRSSSVEEDDPYDYKQDYISRPKSFDSEAYSSPYKQKGPAQDYDYHYDDNNDDSGYDYKAYERIKELSDRQAAEIKQNPENCKEVKRDDMTCMVCKDPKTGGNYESCSYVAEPKNNQYAYSKEKKFDSNDTPEEPEAEHETEKAPRNAKYGKAAPDHSSENEEDKPSENYKEQESEGDPQEKYKAYYAHSSKPNAEYKAASDDEGSPELTESSSKPYDYQKAIPGFYTEPKKDVEHVLAEFKKKDRSSCKKVYKNGMTCFQCIDKSGLKNEECMFVSESAPQKSHLAYQELKEFTSKPATLENGAESQIVTTNAPLVGRPAAYVVANNNYGKKLKRKKARTTAATYISDVPSQSPYKQKIKRESNPEEQARIVVDETNVPPEEFAGADSRGAFWAETMPRYSPTLGVTLPEYMLARSEHEISFDEAVAGA